MRLKIEQVADGVHAVCGSNGMPNAAFVEADEDGVIIVDSLFTPVYAEEMVEGVHAITDAPVMAMLNTHFHCDHVFGNPAIPTERIIAHERCLQRLEGLGDGYVELIRNARTDLRDELEGVRLRLPTETVGDDGLALSVGGMRLEIRYAGRTAHTDHDLHVRIPERGVLLAADLIFHGVAPVMRDGDLLGLRTSLEELRDEHHEVVVPGHGEVGGPELFDRQLEFIDIVMESADKAVNAGAGAEHAAELALERLGGLIFARERIIESTQQAVEAVRH